MRLKNLKKIKKMDRRSALKNLTMSIGYAVAAPTLFSLLSSCNSKVETWKPIYLSEDQKHMVENLVDIILPSSNTPGALDVNVPQFIDIMYHDIEQQNNQQLFQKGSKVFQEKFEGMFGKNVIKGSKEEFQELFESYFKLSDEDTQKVLSNQKLNERKIGDDEKSDYYMYNFLFSVRYYTLFGYCTSEKVGKEVLNYDPVPGVYQGCIPLEDVGNAWSL